VASEVRRVALTFDDGPGPHTARLLADLADRDVRATFFVVGSNVDAHPELVRAALRDGHEIGNHTYDHPDLTRLDRGAVRDQIDRTTSAITAATGRRPGLARPPYGSTDQVVEEVLRERGYRQVLWDVDSEDWRTGDAAATAERVLAEAHDGATILLHDVLPSTVAAATGIVDALRERGFGFVTVTGLTSSGATSTRS
jgi:peptidoglycan/xylan/chitin deacetylase (PgdA/CDA1 family)